MAQAAAPSVVRREYAKHRHAHACTQLLHWFGHGTGLVMAQIQLSSHIQKYSLAAVAYHSLASFRIFILLPSWQQSPGGASPGGALKNP